MNYKEVSKALDKMRNQNEMLFRMAISHLMDVGIRHLTNENVEYTCKKIMEQDDSRSFVTNAFQCEIVKNAAELAKFDHIYVLTYISENIKYDVA